MLNLAIGWAFLITFMWSPGGKLLSAIIEPTVFRTFPPYQGVLAGVFANYWMPALVIYVVLNLLRAGRFLKQSPGIHILFGICNVILCAYALLRVFTSTIEGGGTTFALASVGAFATVPALAGLGVGTMWLGIRSIVARGEAAKSESRPWTAPLKAAGTIAAVILLIPPFAHFGWLYGSHRDQIQKVADARNARTARLDELCDTAVRAEIRKAVPGAKSVHFQLINNATYPVLERLDFVELKNTWAKPGEPPYQRMVKKPNEPVFVNGSLNVNSERIAEPSAEYEISVRLLNTKEDTNQGIAVEEMSIIDRRSGETIAVFAAVSERSVRVTSQTRFCGAGSDYAGYQRDATSYALGLMNEKESSEFEKRLAALKNKVPGGAK